MKARIYLAGPEVFLPDATAMGKVKKDLCSRYGFEGVFPFDAHFDPADLEKKEQGVQICRNNEQLIRSCHLLIANMTPFRGPSMDVGTAFEVGFARALEKPVLGYSNDARPLKDRIVSIHGPVHKQENGRLEDRDQMEIEDFDLTDNLMIDGAVYQSSHTWVVVPGANKKKYYTDLAGFEQCLMLAGKFLVPDGSIPNF